jgi:UDP-N-acetyl-D-glucosamine dehydrogenase
MRPARVVVVGMGYVGLPLAIRAVDVGHTVVALDSDARRIKRLLAGESYVEDVTAQEVRDALATERFSPTTDPADATAFDVAVIAVPTPLREGVPDLSYIQAAAAALAPLLQRGATVVLESTTYPGTTEELVAQTLEDGSGLAAGREFKLGYSPERVDPGNPVHTFVTTPKLVSGIDDESLQAVDAFYGDLVDTTVPVSSTAVAEMAKLVENTFRHVNIALVNELAMYAADLGIDLWEAIDAANTKPFGFMAFRPGPGVGGHCLPIDPSYLSWRVRHRLGRTFRFVELANDINSHMPEYVTQRAIGLLNRAGKPARGSCVLLLGLAYKANSSDAREAPAIVVAEQLLGLGAEVWAADPHVVEEPGVAVRRVDANAEIVAAADLVIVLTDHEAFDFDLVGANAARVLDTRRRMAPAPNVEYL